MWYPKYAMKEKRMRQNIELELSQKPLVTMIRERLSGLTDVRTGKNSRYELSDAALSAFAVFFLQNPSFLAQPWCN
jgi:hypothetical protein